MTTAVTTALTSLLVGAAVSGCGSGNSAEERSADAILEDANETMRTLTSVTVEVTNTVAGGGTVTSRLVTDLDTRCTSRTTWSRGGTLEQIRIGETDYVRPDRAYLQKWSNSTAVRTEQGLWAKTPVDRAQPGDGLNSCTRPFGSFGTATQGKTTRIDGRKALELTVTDEEDKEGTYTFYVATEGKPYLLRTVYKGAENRTTTSFGDFNEPLDIQPPNPTEVLSTDDTDR
jgi:hypothetical protein